MKDFMLEKLEKGVSSLIDIIKENPRNSLVAILIFFIIVPAMGEYLINSFGLITQISYYFTCVYGFTRIVHDPYRPLYWGVGFAFGAVATDLVFSNFIPTVGGGNMVSIFSGLVVLIVIVSIYIKSRELKSM